MSDNVTPFRPRRQPPPPPKASPLKTPRGKVLFAYGLSVAAFALHFLGSGPVDWVALAAGVAALAITASQREEGMPWARTHHEFLLRTLIGGGAGWVLAMLAGAIPGIGAGALYALLAVLAWVGLRCAVGVVRAILRRPVPQPATLLI